MTFVEYSGTLAPDVGMSKEQFWTLNIVGGACALLIVGTLVMGETNSSLNQTAMTVQNQFNQAQQLQNTAQNLVGRIAQAAQKEPALQALLIRHQFAMATNNPTSSTP